MHRQWARGWKLILEKLQMFGNWDRSIGAFPFLATSYRAARPPDFSMPDAPKQPVSPSSKFFTAAAVQQNHLIAQFPRAGDDRAAGSACLGNARVIPRLAHGTAILPAGQRAVV